MRGTYCAKQGVPRTFEEIRPVADAAGLDSDEAIYAEGARGSESSDGQASEEAFRRPEVQTTTAPDVPAPVAAASPLFTAGNPSGYATFSDEEKARQLNAATVDASAWAREYAGNLPETTSAPAAGLAAERNITADLSELSAVVHRGM